jgi:hypothetical protein
MDILPLDFKVDREHWGKAFDPTNKEHLIEQIINGYIAHMMIYYRRTYCEGEDLWYTFHKDFEGIMVNIFNIAQWTALRELQEQLVIDRVWVKPARGSISYAKALYNYLSKAVLSEWTEEHIKEREQIKGKQRITQPQTSKLQ